MKLIPLSRGLFAEVDDEDFDSLNKNKWYALKGGKTFYAVRNKSRSEPGPSMIYMHRQIMSPDSSSVLVDHRDLNGLNNKKKNLRTCSHSQNKMNRGPNKNNPIGIKGVILGLGYKRYKAEIMVQGVSHNLGLHNTPEEAGEAYKKAAAELHGDFARTTK